MVNEAQDTQALLDRFQKTSYAYFAEQRTPANGLVRDKTAADWPSSIAVLRNAACRLAINRAAAMPLPETSPIAIPTLLSGSPTKS